MTATTRILMWLSTGARTYLNPMKATKMEAIGITFPSTSSRKPFKNPMNADAAIMTMNIRSIKGKLFIDLLPPKPFPQ